MVSVPDPDRRFLSFILTTDALRPDFVNSAFWTTIGSFPTMITLPARISWAIFIAAPSLLRVCFGKLYIIPDLRPPGPARWRAREGGRASPPTRRHGRRVGGGRRRNRATPPRARRSGRERRSMRGGSRARTLRPRGPGRRRIDRGTRRPCADAHPRPAGRRATRKAAPPTARVRTSPRPG